VNGGWPPLLCFQNGGQFRAARARLKPGVQRVTPCPARFQAGEKNQLYLEIKKIFLIFFKKLQNTFR
jgi:hypothetical protein